MTVDVPNELHEAFARKCFLATPRVTMRDRLLAFIAEETGRPVPTQIDRRRLTLAERAKLDRPAKPRRPKKG